MMDQDTASTPDEKLSLCLDRFVDGEWTLADCTERFPEQREELIAMLGLASALQAGAAVAPRAAFRRQATARLQARLAASHRRPRQAAPLPGALALPLSGHRVAAAVRTFFAGLRSARVGYALAALLVVMLLAAATATTADAAAPGDALYPLDQVLEQARLLVTPQPEARAALRLDYAGERLEEARALAEEGDGENLQLALASYRVQMDKVARFTEGAVPAGADLEAALAAHEAQLEQIFARMERAAAVEPAAVCDSAPGDASRRHPVATALSVQYGRSYEEVIGLFCDGYGFGEIMLALTTSARVDLSPEAILQLKAESGGWGALWRMLEEGAPVDHDQDAPEDPEDEERLPADTGRPDDPGRPDDAGPPDDPGPPPDVGPSDEDDDRGPPDDPGPPEDRGAPGPWDAGDDPGPPDDDEDDPDPPEDGYNPGPPDDDDDDPGPPEDDDNDDPDPPDDGDEPAPSDDDGDDDPDPPDDGDDPEPPEDDDDDDPDPADDGDEPGPSDDDDDDDPPDDDDGDDSARPGRSHAAPGPPVNPGPPGGHGEAEGLGLFS